MRVGAARLPGLRGQFGDDLTVVRPLDDDQLELEIRGPSAEELADGLAGWADDLEVLEPPAVRGRLAFLGAELVRRYG